MTMTDTDEATAIAAVALERIARTPSRREVLSAIVAEAHIRRSSAGEFLAWLRIVVDVCRSRPAPRKLLSQDEIDRFHATLETIIPDDTVSAPGTAHDKIERYLLDPAAGELSIKHTKHGVGRARFCSVDVEVGIF